jgi:hypothetical protein
MVKKYFLLLCVKLRTPEYRVVTSKGLSVRLHRMSYGAEELKL